jgi:hypothetical protein
LFRRPFGCNKKWEGTGVGEEESNRGENVQKETKSKGANKEMKEGRNKEGRKEKGQETKKIRGKK